LIQEEVKEPFLMELKLAIQKMYDPKYEGIVKSKDLARIINLKNFNRIQGLFNDAFEKGVKVDFGGTFDPETLFIEPTLLSNLKEGMHILEEEIFGPLLPIISYKDIDEAISIINSKPKPLALYYFGEENNTFKRVIQETSSGNAVLNDCVLHFIHPNLPFGGVNNSGIGKSHGYFGYLAFSNEKGVLKQRIGFNNSTMLTPPYDNKTQKIISTLIKWL
ncbi:aldehyde dehydrogenase family protein, partial [Algoriphagus sp.]|uniref:aldehyde dehydrogenase family protein n=1 Tax=Algoriphagus sp. TaxID=1872435 RepID=UPI0025DF8978